MRLLRDQVSWALMCYHEVKGRALCSAPSPPSPALGCDSFCSTEENAIVQRLRDLATSAPAETLLTCSRVAPVYP